LLLLVLALPYTIWDWAFLLTGVVCKHRVMGG